MLNEQWKFLIEIDIVNVMLIRTRRVIYPYKMFYFSASLQFWK